MSAVILIILFLLIISAPWISRKWGGIGEIAWGIISIAFVMFIIIISQ